MIVAPNVAEASVPDSATAVPAVVVAIVVTTPLTSEPRNVSVVPAPNPWRFQTNRWNFVDVDNVPAAVEA